MQINKTDNTHFGIKIKPEHIFEATTECSFSTRSIEGFKDVFEKFAPVTTPGNFGFKGWAKRLGKEITEKYPEINQDTNKILDFIEDLYNSATGERIIKENSFIAKDKDKIIVKIKSDIESKKEIDNFAKDIIAKYGEEIDIVI